MLKSLPTFSDLKLIRTRDQNIIDEATIVVDVGSIYDPQKLRFDHHQREFLEFFDENHKIKLSSAGLIYKHFGRELISNRFSLKLDDQCVEILYQKMYDDFIQAVNYLSLMVVGWYR